MFKLYERVSKSEEYLYGIKPIEDNENPFAEGPWFLSISAQYNNDTADRSNFGMAKEGMKMARLRVRGQKNAGYNIKGFPVKFLAIQRESKKEENILSEDKAIFEFIQKYLYPLIEKDGQKIDVIQAMKNMRNVNIMCYCNGTTFAQNIENVLIQRMQELGYNAEEIRKIQSQMCMFPIATDKLDGNQISTCISFKDINDDEVNENVTDEEIKKVEESSMGETIIKYSENEIAYLFNGDGEHQLKKYTEDGKAIPVCLSSAVCKALENSINNSTSDYFTPISARTTYRRFYRNCTKC